jgi:hypothetical protein
VRPNLISCYLSIREDSEEDIRDVVRECPAIIGERRWSCGVIAQKVRQQCLCHPRGLVWLIPTCMLQRMREDGNETSIVRRFPSEVRSVLLAGKEGSL